MHDRNGRNRLIWIASLDWPELMDILEFVWLTWVYRLGYILDNWQDRMDRDRYDLMGNKERIETCEREQRIL